MSMRSYSRAGITRRLFNTPLAVLPSTAAIVLGVVGPKFDVSQLLMHGSGEATPIADLTASADAARTDIEAKRGSADQRPGTTAADWRIDVQDGVAHINIRGETVAENGGGVNPSSGFTGYDAVGAAWTVAQRDVSVKGVIVDIESPGGEVTDLFELAASMMADRGNKPSRAIIRGTGASAAYAIACCCDEITVQEFGYAGSVGVITMHADFSGQLEQEGVKVTLIAAGAHKADGNPFEALPDDVRAEIQGDIDRIYTQFVSHVATARGMSEDAVRSTEARVYQGQQAVDIGFVTKVMSWKDSQAEFVAAVNGRQPPAKSPRGSKSAAAHSAKDIEMAENANDDPAAIEQPENTITTEAAAAATALAVAEARTAAAVEERMRILTLAGLCPESTISASLQTAIDGGTDAGAFAIGLATEAKSRGASLKDLKNGTVASDQLPNPGNDANGEKKPLAGAARSNSILQRAAAAGHSALKHLAPAK